MGLLSEHDEAHALSQYSEQQFENSALVFVPILMISPFKSVWVDVYLRKLFEEMLSSHRYCIPPESGDCEQSTSQQPQHDLRCKRCLG